MGSTPATWVSAPTTLVPLCPAGGRGRPRLRPMLVSLLLALACSLPLSTAWDTTVSPLPLLSTPPPLLWPLPLLWLPLPLLLWPPRRVPCRPCGHSDPGCGWH